MTHRPGHFMPTTLLDSQLTALEPPTADEHPVELDVTLPSAQLVDDAVAALLARHPAPRADSEEAP